MQESLPEDDSGLSTPLLDDSILAHYPRACQLMFSVLVVTYAATFRTVESKFQSESLLSFIHVAFI